MAKKCLICEGPAIYTIKDTSDFYCGECAEEQFGDLSLLVKLEPDTQVKKTIKEKIADAEEEEF